MKWTHGVLSPVVNAVGEVGGLWVFFAFEKLGHEKERVWVKGWGAGMRELFNGAEKDVKEPPPMSDSSHHLEVTHGGTPHFVN